MMYTGILAEIAEVAGADAAELMARVKGGNEHVYIPKPTFLADGHWLVNLLGISRATAIAKRLGGCRVEIPLGETAKAAQRAKVIETALAEGKSSATAARLAGCHMRTVRRHRNKDQGELF